MTQGENPDWHIDTRHYVHLASDGSAFCFVSPKRYKPIPAAEAFAAVFAGLPRLGDVTEEQVALSWAAVDRLTQRDV